MKRWGLWIALMLSLGLNVGVLFMVVVNRGAQRQPAVYEPVEPLLPVEPEGPAGDLLPEEPSSPAETGLAPPTESEPPPLPRVEPAPSPSGDPKPPAPSEPPTPSKQEEPIEPVLPTPSRPAVRTPAVPPAGRGPSAEALLRAEPKLELLADRLRLRGQGRQRFLEAQRRFFTVVTARRVELATLRQEIRRELISPIPDRQRIRRLLERSGRATAELDAAFAQNVLTVRRILGPRQQQAYFRFLERLRSGLEAQNR